jgi:DNA-directed RNA polymerase specialized sigma24 family protein
MPSIKHRDDLLKVLRLTHRQIYRISLVLCGDRSATEQVVKKVILQSGQAARKWETPDDAQRWLMHYTVLLSRAVQTPGNDTLLESATDPDEIAVIQAIRQLPTQQREAFVLHHGEAMELRQLATAMDCSTTAAANHLVAAVGALKGQNLIGLGDFTTNLPGRIEKLLPPPQLLETSLEDAMLASDRLWRRVVLLWLKNAIVLACIGWLIWWILSHVELVRE